MAKLLSITDGPKLVSCTFKRKKRPPKEERPAEVSCDITTGINVNGDSKISMRVGASSTSPALPFDFDVTVQASFDILVPVTEEERENLVATDGGPVIYSVLREIIADLTRKANYPPLYLPDLDFSNLEDIKPKAKPKRTSLKKQSTSENSDE